MAAARLGLSSTAASRHLAAAARHAGIVFEPAFIVGPEVRAGRLVEFAALPMPRLFVDFLIERFSHAQDWSAA